MGKESRFFTRAFRTRRLPEVLSSKVLALPTTLRRRVSGDEGDGRRHGRGQLIGPRGFAYRPCVLISVQFTAHGVPTAASRARRWGAIGTNATSIIGLVEARAQGSFPACGRAWL